MARPVTPDIPTVLVVFGATGDLMRHKIVPSLYFLFDRGYLPERTTVVGVSRRDWDDVEFRGKVRGILEEAPSFHECSEEQMGRFLGLWRFCGGHFQEPGLYGKLSELLKDIDAEWGTCSNKIHFMAVPPAAYGDIFAHMAERGLTQGCGGPQGWTRIMVEKPFGHDRASASALDDQLAQHFREEQIYRIDHYLAKEMLQSLLDFRFQNNLFEPEWHHGAIESIEIDLLENIGAETRGAFYDAVGALRDVGQNHCLEMLALLTMEQPATDSAEALRDARAELLRHLVPLTADEMTTSTYRAQYRGFCDIDGVRPDSRTETYFKLRCLLDVPKWRDVPIVIQAGKRTGEPRKRVTVTLRHPTPCMCESGAHHANTVTFTLEPTDSIKIAFWTKKPGIEGDVEGRKFDFFLYEKQEKQQYVEEYSKLIHEAVMGDQRLFVSRAEVDACWAFVDPIEAAWAAGRPPLATYPADTTHAVDEARLISADAAHGEGLREEIGFIGLGKMGRNLARNLLDHGWTVHGYNRTTSVAESMRGEGLLVATTPQLLVAELRKPRLLWLMLPAGPVVDTFLWGDGTAGGGLVGMLEPGDTIVDGGNSRYTDTVARARRLAETGIRFLDCGTSGGPSGARYGACLMIGGKREDFDRLHSLWADLSVPGGFRFFEGHGAGHFVKMGHNGIEYGMMQALAEGFAVMRAVDYDLDLTSIADVYNHGSVVESRLVGWLRDAFRLHGEALEGVSGSVAQTGEGAWTAQTADELGVKAKVIEYAVRFRTESEDQPSYTGQLLSALRERFGGHGVASRE